MHRDLSIILLMLLGCATCLGQSSYKGITPGKSRKVEVERVLGPPVKQLSETLVEYRPQPLAGRIYVQYRAGSGVVERIEFICRLPDSNCNDFTKSLNLGLPPTGQATSATDEKGKYLAFNEPPHYVVETIAEGGELENNQVVPVRIAFYSRELYEAEVAKAKKTREEEIAEAEIKAEEARRSPPPLTGGYGEITGIVKSRAADGSLQPVANATVGFYRIDPPNRIQTKTDRHGIFQYVGLSQTGTWVVVVSGPGLKWAHLDGVRTPVAGLEIIAESGDGSVPTIRDVENVVKKN